MPTAIPLTKGAVALIDHYDLEWLSQFRWCFAWNGYAVHYYANEHGRRKTLYMHREIFTRILGYDIPPNMQVDHINHNRIDNRRSNLRLATRSQNQAHKGRPVNNTSQYKGVSFNTGKWEARIRYSGQRIHLGRYDDALTAALMYDAASRLLNREFAGCNFPMQPTPPHIEGKLRELLNKRGLDISQLMLRG